MDWLLVIALLIVLVLNVAVLVVAGWIAGRRRSPRD